MLSVRSTRLAVVDGKGPKHAAVLRRDGGRPAGSQAVSECHLAIVHPQGVGRYIGDDDWLLTINGGTARSRVRPDLQHVDRLAVFLRKAGSSSTSQSHTVRVQKKDGAQHSRIKLLEVSAQSVQYPGERSLTHDHSQYPVVEQ